ncbi:MAG: hypothetical protein EXR86_06545 [Gammaproteobacteria bacterium]|nr:hypothetical protein [Gammaproteobacteria bacterium]
MYPAYAAQDPISLGQSLLTSLTPDAPTADYARASREFGNAVDGVRQTDVSDAVLERLREISNQLRARTHERLSAAEAEAGDSEGDLEQIYKSATWDDLSFALSAFPYWRAWIDLTLAERPSQIGKRARRLWQAKRGFRAASMQIYQPSLVYGGWLGLGYIAKAEKQSSRATQIFTALKKALAADPAHPVYKMVEAEMAIMRGEAPPPNLAAAQAGSGANIETEMLRAEAVALLQQHRTKEVGAREAAERLRKIIDSNQMTMAILGDILSFQVEIARESLSTYTDLVLAEFNFNNQQWYTAVQKYRAFFREEPVTPGMNFDRFKYRLAVAMLKSDLNDDAAREAEKLLRNGVEPVVQKAATKLAYIARAGHADNQATNAGKAALGTAAKRFLAQSPSDPDADGARLILAQQSNDPGAALRYLDSVKSTAKFAGGVEMTRFYLIAKDFARATQTGTGLESLAREGLSAWEGLPAEEKKSPLNQAFFTQLRAVTEPRMLDVLKSIEISEQKTASLGPSVKRAYLWSRLKIYERLGEPERMLRDIEADTTEKIEGWKLEQYYPFVRKLTNLDLRIRIATTLEPRLKGQPEMERRFRLMAIEDLLAAGQGDAGYDAAKRLIKDYPRAGDGYRMLAKAAQQTKRLVEADNAWRIITEKVPPKQDVWWEGMLSRIDIRLTSTRPEAACELIATVDQRLPAPKDEFKTRFASLRQRATCPRQAGT